jgi:hypothetical protein
MPEPGITPADAASAGTLEAGVEAGGDQPSAEAPARTNWFFYGLGLSLQTFLWFLLFLALVVAVAVGGELTEFRYVGF